MKSAAGPLFAGAARPGIGYIPARDRRGDPAAGEREGR